MSIADANFVLRYVLNDDQRLASRAAMVLEREEVLIPFEVVAEIVYVLIGVYGVPRRSICATLKALFSRPNVNSMDRDVLFEACTLLATSRLDFVDCLLIAYNKVRGHDVHTFDKRLAGKLR